MDDSLLEFILKAQQLEYAVFDKEGNLTYHSPGFLGFYLSAISGVHIMDIFPELVGSEGVLAAIQKNEHPPLSLKNIHSPHLTDQQGYIDINVHAYNKGLLAIIRDTTYEGNLEQTITQQRNELRLLTVRLSKEFAQAYDSTLFSWASSLECHEYEPRGHSQRVADLTVKLAQVMGIEGEELEHYRRGALLHDIGKITISPEILLKPEPLNAEEWQVVRNHPLAAYDFLKSVSFLLPAISIPYCHHEKWDGTGYPNGLKGEKIPLPARIFAIIDVWDVLRSSRPFRKEPWGNEKTMDYIQENKGTHFDPQVVEAFFKLLSLPS